MGTGTPADIIGTGEPHHPQRGEQSQNAVKEAEYGRRHTRIREAQPFLPQQRWEPLVERGVAILRKTNLHNHWC
jgi:hypothetical protein